MSPNIAASIKARLLNKMRSEGSNFEFELFHVRYACERFLYRLGASSIRDQYVLKGANLLELWINEPYRATRDIDLLALGESNAEIVRGVIASICSLPCPEDGMEFDFKTLRLSSIGNRRMFSGQRAKLKASLGTACIPVQVDFSFGDVVTLEPEEVQLPTLIDNVPAPILRIYPKVTTIAEKFETMGQRGTQNSRMKDFYDIWALSETCVFEGPRLQEAVMRCFDHRGTPWTSEIPDALTASFYTNAALQDLWTIFRHQGGLLYPPPDSFENIGIRIQSFLGPVRTSILLAESFENHWPAGGPWHLRVTRTKSGQNHA